MARQSKSGRSRSPRVPRVAASLRRYRETLGRDLKSKDLEHIPDAELEKLLKFVDPLLRHHEPKMSVLYGFATETNASAKEKRIFAAYFTNIEAHECEDD